MVPHDQFVTALILAGGKGRRLDGQDKGLIELLGRPLIEYILETITAQTSSVLINANRNQDAYQGYGHTVISDALSDYQGPLAGFAIGMKTSSTPYIVTLPCDGPFVPVDLVSRLVKTLKTQNADIAVAHDGTRIQPVYALIPVNLLSSLSNFLESGDRKIDRWYTQHNFAYSDFSDQPEAFLNINTADDLEQIERLMRSKTAEYNQAQ
jgi:molybdenum cofactor guanylyltransferase